jgi:hypothetical protein
MPGQKTAEEAYARADQGPNEPQRTAPVRRAPTAGADESFAC